MNKILKGAIACAAVIPCFTGLVGCGEKKYSAETAYNSITSELGGIVTEMSNMANEGKEFQLNLNLSIDYKMVSNAVGSVDTNFKATIRGAIGATGGDAKKAFANLGLVGTDDEIINLLTAYAFDDVDDVDGDSDEKYIEVIPTADTWQYYKDIVYVEGIDEDYVLAGDEFDATATYFMKTEDYVHIYLASNVTEFAEATGIDINELLAKAMGEGFEMPEGKVYATLNVGDALPDIPTEPEQDPVQPEEGPMGVGAILDAISSMDYDTFIASIEADQGMKVSAKKTGAGDAVLTISGYGTTMAITAKAQGGLRLAVNSDQLQEGTQHTVSMVLDIDLLNEVDTNNIPTELEGYNEEPVDFEELIAELVSGF